RRARDRGHAAGDDAGGHALGVRVHGVVDVRGAHRVAPSRAQRCDASYSRRAPGSMSTVTLHRGEGDTGEMESPAPSLPPLHQTYAAAVPELSIPWRAEQPPQPEIVWLNEELAAELGMDPEQLRGAEGMALLTGQTEGTTAQVYAGQDRKSGG